MPTELEYTNDRTLARERGRGSDGRINVSARQDERIYYSSRDNGQAYTLLFNDLNCTADDWNVSLFNDSTDKDLVIHSIGINADANSKVELHIVTGTAGGGAVAATPGNLNTSSSNVAAVVASTVVASDSSEITGLTSSVELDHANVLANGHEEFRVQDSIRLGQGKGIAVRAGTGVSAGTQIYGVIFFYLEDKR